MQDSYIFAESLKANIILGSKPDDNRINEVIKTACLDQFVKDHPLGLDTKLGNEGVGVSGGEKQRIMIARAIYRQPLYLFMDEATSSLDAETEKVITENLKNFGIGRTMIVMVHIKD